MPADARLLNERFPRSNRYHPEWVMANVSGGANSLWLTEWLSGAMDLRPGMRVLDLGCGRASSSIFLRREVGVQVWATDCQPPGTGGLHMFSNQHPAKRTGEGSLRSMPASTRRHVAIVLRNLLLLTCPLVLYIGSFVALRNDGTVSFLFPENDTSYRIVSVRVRYFSRNPRLNSALIFLYRPLILLHGHSQTAIVDGPPSEHDVRHAIERGITIFYVCDATDAGQQSRPTFPGNAARRMNDP